VTNVREMDNRIPKDKFMDLLGEERRSIFGSRTWPLILDQIRAALLACRDAVKVSGETYRASKEVSAGPDAFEMLGMDVAIDSDMRPWLLEVNVSPDTLGMTGVDWLQAFAYEALESLLGIVLDSHDSILDLPSDVELGKMKGADGLERLFTSKVLAKGHGDRCYGRLVAETPPALVGGLDLGGDFGKWLLAFRESAANARRCTVGVPPPPPICAEPGTHERVLSDVLYPLATSGPQRYREGALTKKSSQKLTPLSLPSPSNRGLLEPLGTARIVRPKAMTFPSLKWRSRSLPSLNGPAKSMGQTQSEDEQRG